MGNTLHKSSKQLQKEKTTLFLGLTWLDIIGLVIILGFRFIPAPAPLTKEGMQVIGTLLGIAFIYSTVGTSWGTFLGWLGLAAPAKVLMESKNGLNSVMTLTLGDNIVAFVLISLMLCYGLKQSGFMDQFSYWFMRTKFATKSPWSFFFAWMLLSFILGLFIETIPLCIFMLGVAHRMFERMGFQPGDKFPSCLVIATVFSSLCSYVATPLVVGGGYKAMAVASAFFDGQIPMVQYSLCAAPALILTFLFVYLAMRYIIKPDTSKLEGANYAALMGDKPQPMTRQGKLLTAIYLLVMLFWILPNFLDMLAPGWAFTKWCSETGSLGFALIALTLMFLLKVDGKPLINMADAFKSVPWGIVCVMATTRAIATLLSKDGTGFKEWIGVIVGSVSGNISPWLIVVVICLLCAVCTQFASNTPVYTIAIAALVPQAALLGMSGGGVAVMISAAAGLALTLPSGFAFLSYLVGDEWCRNGDQLKVGTLSVILHFVLAITLTFGLTRLIFG